MAEEGKEKVEVIKVHLGVGVERRPKKKRIKRKGRGVSDFFRDLLAKLGIKRRKPAVKKAEMPVEVREALEESKREKSKIEGMIKERGRGWFGDRLRHQQIALKAWEGRRERELAALEKKEEREGLSRQEKSEKMGLAEEVERVSDAVKQIEGHLREIRGREAGKKPAEVSMAVMEEARKVAEKAAEAAKAMPKYAPGKEAEKPVRIILEEIKTAEKEGNIDEEIKHYKNLIKRIEYDYLKRRISEEDYRKRLSEYQQRLVELEEKKKLVGKKKVVERKPLAAGRVVTGQAVEKAVALQKPSAAPLTAKAVKTLEKGTPPEVTHERVEEIEKYVGDLLKKYKISKEEVEKEFGTLDKNRIIQDFDKLINLIELEKEAKKMEAKEIAAPPKTEIPFISRKKEKIKAMAKEIKKYRIVTDFDGVLNYVRKKGKVNVTKARKELHMDKKRFKECCDVLEKSKLIKIEYPAIGRMKLLDINYKEEKKKKGKKKK